ncbi:MAG: hypothetical protein HZA48_12455 [Planctomycetes bacterium]|nr:hypothetical protein [Planctomycetota bacterium]
MQYIYFKECNSSKHMYFKDFLKNLTFDMKLPKPPKEWLSTYANSEFQVITKENYIEFIT